MTITFQNPGEMDPRAFQLSGVNAKQTSNAFGHFGTGLKYALAILAREQQSCSIFIGTTEYKLGLTQMDFRGKGFQQIVLGNEALPFTTELGKNWEIWQALRELFCNALDEAGGYGDYAPCPGTTTIVVSGAAAEHAWTTRREWIIEAGELPVVESSTVRIFPSRGAPVFYQGVRASKPSKTSEYTFDLQSSEYVKLTEDRTIAGGSWWLMQEAGRCAARSENKDFVQRFFNRMLAEDSWESQNLSVPRQGQVSQAFLAFCERVVRKHGQKAPDWAKEWMGKEKPELLAHALVKLSKVQQSTLDRAIEFLGGAGYNVDPAELIVTDLPDGLLGCVEHGQIYIGLQAFKMGGPKLVASTILEEWLHKTKELRDCTRAMQEWLFNELLSKLEEMRGEPV